MYAAFSAVQYFGCCCVSVCAAGVIMLFVVRPRVVATPRSANGATENAGLENTGT